MYSSIWHREREKRKAPGQVCVSLKAAAGSAALAPPNPSREEDMTQGRSLSPMMEAATNTRCSAAEQTPPPSISAGNTSFLTLNWTTR